VDTKNHLKKMGRDRKAKRVGKQKIVVMKKHELKFLIISVLLCIFVSGCNFNNKKDKKPVKMQITQFSQLLTREDQLFYNNNDTIPYTGKVVENWDSSAVRLEFFCENGLKDSTELQWFPNGKIKSKCRFKQGLLEDTITKWYETGQKMVSAYYKDGIITGELTVWYLNDKKFRVTNYANGKKNGYETTWLKNGDTTTVIEYKNNELNGIQTVYNKNGIRRNTTHNTPIPPAVDGKHYVDMAEKNHSLNREVYFDNIEVDKGLIYVKGEKTPYYGKIICLYPNKKIKWTQDNVNGIAQGKVLGWYESEAKQYKMNYLWGESQGLLTRWYENGEIETEGVVSIGDWTGIVRRYYESGTIESEADFIQGLKFGTEINYYENGMKKSLVEYICNEVMSETTWDDKGNLIKSITNKQ
jgi:uncharacterized protein